VLSHSERPRELRWYHAAGMLFGDWGTSRLYVLGLAFVMSGHASFWYVAAMCTLVSLVGFSYTIICSHFPDGGGVYSAAKHRSRTLAVIGALLLIADYIITAALSTYEGFRYMLPAGTPSIYALYAAIVSIFCIGAVNIVGPRRAGQVALVIGIIAAVFYAVIAAACLPALGSGTVHRPLESYSMQWSHFVNVILALSGVEAIANMTGVMAEPVAKNAKKAILVVLIEVVVFNLVMGWAMNALPALQGIEAGSLDAAAREDYRDHMVKILAAEYVGPWFASISSVFFGFLLLSAANTAIGDMVSIQYLMSRDKELPPVFTSLNRFGMPWVGLASAVVVSSVVLFLVGNDTEMLAGLYAIGVVGAITINLLTCGSNFSLDLKKWERVVLLSVGVLVLLIEVTIAIEKPSALLFAVIVLSTGLLGRYIAQRRIAVPAIEPAILKPEVSPTQARALVPAGAARILVPSRGHPKLLNFAITYAKDKKAVMFLLFVREVSLAFKERGASVGTEAMTLESDSDAQKLFAEAKKMCGENGVIMVPLYAVHDSPAEIILDHAATLGVDAVLMGVSQRGALWKTLKGDVLQEVISYLPPSIPLLIHA
jgi:amino acid transporter/nucleotide-binding universal stress UspA family protein